MKIDFKTDLINTAIEIETALKEYSLDKNTFIDAFTNYSEVVRHYLMLVQTDDENKLDEQIYAELKTKLLNISLKVWKEVANSRTEAISNSQKVTLHKFINKNTKQDLKKIDELTKELEDNITALPQKEKIAKLKEIVEKSNQILGRNWLSQESVGLLSLLVGAVAAVLTLVSIILYYMKWQI